MKVVDAEAGDEGQVMLLMVFFAVTVAALITAVVDVSTVFLAQREMQSTADGAALAATQQPDLAVVYTSELGPRLPLSRTKTINVLDSYAVDPARIPHECSASSYQVVGGLDADGNQRSGLQADGATVRVELTCKVPLPFLGLVADAFTGGVTIHQVASARSAVTPLAP
ncbi:MAG TPA: Tad domain-containing protein [Acidothermaceae bacterium]